MQIKNPGVYEAIKLLKLHLISINSGKLKISKCNSHVKLWDTIFEGKLILLGDGSSRKFGIIVNLPWDFFLLLCSTHSNSFILPRCSLLEQYILMQPM